jgi:hypothetical protein
MTTDKCFHLAALFGCVNSHLFPLLRFRFSSEPRAYVANTTPEYNENKIHTKIERTADRPQRIRKPNPRSTTPIRWPTKSHQSMSETISQQPKKWSSFLAKAKSHWHGSLIFQVVLGLVPTSNYTQLSSRRW